MNFGSVLGKVADYTPIVSNIKGAAQGNLSQAVGGQAGAAFNDAKQYGGSIVNGLSAHGPQGVGGPAQDPSKLVHDATTGLFYDPTTGTTYLDGTGQNPVKDPNVAQQVAQNFQTRQSLLNNLSADRGVSQQGIAGEQGLAQSLNRTINDPNAPSVAGSQLTQGADALGRTQLAMASGQGGPNAAAARRQASLNIGQAGADLNQQQALRRVNEVQGATGQLGSVLNNLASQGATQYGQDLTGAGGFADLSQKGAGSNQTQQANADNTNLQTKWGLVNGAVGAGSKLLSGGAA